MLNIAVTFATSSKIKTATEVETDKTEDESKLVDIAEIVESGLNKAIELLSYYDKSLTTDKKVYVNKDFDSNKLTPEQINSILTMYKEGLISLDTSWDMLERGEVVDIQDREKEKVALNDFLPLS